MSPVTPTTFAGAIEEIVALDFPQETVGIALSLRANEYAALYMFESEITGSNEPYDLVLTLTDGTWETGTTFDNARQDIIDGITGSASWDAEVQGSMVVGDVVRESDTVVRVEVPQAASYSITENDSVSAEVPAAAVQELGSDQGATGAVTVIEGNTNIGTVVNGYDSYYGAIKVRDPSTPFICGTFDRPDIGPPTTNWGAVITVDNADVSDYKSGLILDSHGNQFDVSTITNYETGNQFSSGCWSTHALGYQLGCEFVSGSLTVLRVAIHSTIENMGNASTAGNCQNSVSPGSCGYRWAKASELPS